MGAVERPRHMRRVEPLRLARSPRQGQHHLRPVQRLVDRRRIGPERPDAAPQRLTRRTGQLGALQGLEHLLEARAGGGQRAHGLERRSDGPAVSRRRNLGGGAGKRCLRRPEPGSTVAEQAQRLRLVHCTNPARGRQVGQAPPLALRRGGDHVGAARGPASALRTARTPDGVQHPAVFVPRRRIDEQHRVVVVPPQQSHAHPLRLLRVFFSSIARPASQIERAGCTRAFDKRLPTG